MMPERFSPSPAPPFRGHQPARPLSLSLSNEKDDLLSTSSFRICSHASERRYSFPFTTDGRGFNKVFLVTTATSPPRPGGVSFVISTVAFGIVAGIQEFLSLRRPRQRQPE